jgi:hypothetical protein
MLVLKRKQFATWGVPMFRSAATNFKSGGANILKAFRNKTLNTNRSLNMTGAQRWRTGLKGARQGVKGGANVVGGTLTAGTNLAGKVGKGAAIVGSGTLALGGLGLAGLHSMATDG